MSILTSIYNNQKEIWSNPEKRSELLKFTAVSALASYVALNLYKQLNENGKTIPLVGFLALPLLNPEQRVVSIAMNASIFLYDNHIKKSNIPAYQIHGAVALAGYIYASIFSNTKKD